MDRLGKLVAEAVIGVDTLWGGDVLCASGTGRFIADSWFSDEKLPAAYTCSAAARIRQTGGVTAKELEPAVIEEYVKQNDIVGAVKGIREEALKIRGLRGTYLAGLAMCIELMWDLAMEVCGKGAPVSYARCVEASTGHAPEQSKPQRKRERVAELLGRAGYSVRRRSGHREGCRCVESRTAGTHGIGAGTGKRGHSAIRQVV